MSFTVNSSHDRAFQDMAPAVLGESSYGSEWLSGPYQTTAFAKYQPCDDCSPSTRTTIPHHHHKSGRLSGASATVAGHFCCSWLVQGQPCFLCFESAEALDDHIKNDHAGKDGTFRCLWQSCCKHEKSAQTAELMSFGNKPKLMRHVHSHTGYKPFPCPFPGCDRGFVTKEQLKNHETTHTKSRKFKCELCDKAFAVKSALTTHITAVHEEKKIHRCNTCGKAFADSSNLSKHKQTHLRDGGIRKQRSKRATSDSLSMRSTPSVSAPLVQQESLNGHTSFNDFSVSATLPGVMAPPTAPRPSPTANHFPPFTYTSLLPTSCTSSPPPESESFDPDCYCCEQRCPLPSGPATPCDEADKCDKDGFCDLPCTAVSPVPCDAPEECCDRDGFCDLPECFEQVDYSPHATMLQPYMPSHHCNEPLMGHHQMEQLRNFGAPVHWNDMLDHDPQRSLTHREVEEQFTHMHAHGS